MQELLGDLMDQAVNPSLAPYAKTGEVMLRLTAKGDSSAACEKRMAPLLEQVRGRLGAYLYGIDVSGLEETVLHLLHQHGKTFSAADVHFGVGQITSVSAAGLKQLVPALQQLMEEKYAKDPSTMLFFLLTNILEENSIVLCAGQKAKELLKQSNHLDEIPAEGLLVPGMVSRKKQFVPSIIATLQQ